MEVTIYTLTECPWCVKAKKFLRKNKIEFKEKNVSQKKYLEEMIKKSGQQGVPVTDINGAIIVGFNEGKLKSALEL